MQRILILSTPRTGSNLLLDSLAEHPDAVTGGEILSANALTHNSPAAIQNLIDGKECNLFKVHWSQRHLLDWRLTDNSLIVHLYRRDIEAQLASWRKACKSGRWCRWDRDPLYADFPTNANHQIFESRIGWSAVADVSITYEHLIECWDATLDFLLRSAGWDAVPLAMAHQTTAENEATESARHADSSQGGR